MASPSDTSSDEEHNNESTIFSDGNSTSYASLILSMAAIADLLAKAKGGTLVNKQSFCNLKWVFLGQLKVAKLCAILSL